MLCCLCVVCLFALACFFLSSFSHLSLKHGVWYVSLCVSQILILFTHRHLYVGCGEIDVNVRDRMVPLIFIHPRPHIYYNKGY